MCVKWVFIDNSEWRGLTLPGWPLTQRRVSPQEQERHTGGALRRWSQSRGQGDAAQAQNPGARVGGWHRDPQSLQRDPLTGSPDVRLAAEQWETTLLSFKPARLKGCAVLTQEEQSIQSVLRRAAAPRQEPAKHQRLRVASRPALGPRPPPEILQPCLSAQDPRTASPMGCL